MLASSTIELKARGRRVEVRFQPYTQPAIAIPWGEVREGPAPAPAGLSRRRPRSTARKRILVAGVGYSNLRDLSVGPVLVNRLQARAWPAGVQVEDLSFGGVHVLHWLQEAEPFDAALFITAVERGEPPGRVRCYDWQSSVVAAEEVQGRVAEAVTGIISLETLLTVVGYFGALPPRVRVIEVEPRDLDWGPDFSAPVQLALDEAETLVERTVSEMLAT